MRRTTVSKRIASLCEPVFALLVQCVGYGTECTAFLGQGVVACDRRFELLVFGLVLVGVGLSLAFGIYPLLGAGAIALFFLGVTPVVHGSWSVEDPERRQAETTDFSKNATFFGAALVFVVLSGTAWPCALTIDL